jgi:hypothetical protein
MSALAVHCVFFWKACRKALRSFLDVSWKFIFLMLIYNILYTGGQEKAGSIQAVPASFSDHRPGGKSAEERQTIIRYYVPGILSRNSF